jgi:hypothetical protein
MFSLDPVTDAAGTTGDTFDVLLTNTGPGAIDVATFSFGLSVATTKLTFEDVSISTVTAPYIFAGNSLFGPDIVSPFPYTPGQTIGGEDLNGGVAGFTAVAAGATDGLGLVTFNLAAGTPPGPIAVSFISADDSLFDPAGSPIAFSVTGGTVTVPGSSAPEPASAILAGIALLAAVAVRRFRRPTPASAPRA